MKRLCILLAVPFLAIAINLSNAEDVKPVNPIPPVQKTEPTSKNEIIKTQEDQQRQSQTRRKTSQDNKEPGSSIQQNPKDEPNKNPATQIKISQEKKGDQPIDPAAAAKKPTIIPVTGPVISPQQFQPPAAPSNRRASRKTRPAATASGRPLSFSRAENIGTSRTKPRRRSADERWFVCPKRSHSKAPVVCRGHDGPGRAFLPEGVGISQP